MLLPAARVVPKGGARLAPAAVVDAVKSFDGATLDFVVFRRPRLQDHEADHVSGAAIHAVEAGGQFTDWKGNATTRGGDGVGTNGHLHEATLALLR